MKEQLARLVRFVAGFRPCLKRDLARQGEKINRLSEKNKLLREKVRSQAKKAKKQAETIARLSALLDRVKAQNADNRYLANLALPREKLRESVVRWWHAKNPGVPLNLDAPQTFCDKIQCLKLAADTPFLTRLADKYAVREWVAGKIGAQRLIPLLGVWDRAEDVDLAALPQRFVLKANHGSHMIRIVKDKAALDIQQLRAEMSAWLTTNYAFLMSPQLQYANIPRKIIAEEYIENGDGELHDWKVWCFKGRAHYVEFMSRKDGRLRFVYLDREWNPAPFGYSNVHDTPLEAPPKPGNLNELLGLAETLAAGFEFVRVDFYRLDDGTYLFGEMTFTPAGGNGQFDPPEWNARIGELFDYTPDNRIPGAPA
ncbi:MAG: hypothetical protein IJH50_06335 [Kiritimatiellae bacterium]|nr:hypothetical protein [Kiritimatiellia bacterium]